MEGLISIDLSAIPNRLTGAGRYGVEMLKAVLDQNDQETLSFLGITRSGDGDRMTALIPTLRFAELVPNGRVSRLAYERLFMASQLRRRNVKLHHGIHYTSPEPFGGRVVVTVHDTTFIDHPEWHERTKVGFFRHAIAKAANRADALIFPSQFARDRFELFYPNGGERVVIPHGVDVSQFGVVSSESIAATKLSHGISDEYLFYCGTIEPRKNLGRILDAFASTKIPGLQFVIAGLSGWRNSKFFATLEPFVKSGKIRVLGYVSDADLGSLYAGSVATIYPSLEEGFGLPGLEALAMGSKLITSVDSAMAEYANESTYLVNPYDTDEIAKAIIGVYDHFGGGERDRSLGLSSEDELLAKYSWTISGQRHLELYRSILSI